MNNEETDMSEFKVYEFENDSNSCVIKTTAPPRYWYNYLWNENGYCAQVSQIETVSAII